jgi:hypothetical protein
VLADIQFKIDRLLEETTLTEIQNRGQKETHHVECTIG